MRLLGLAPMGCRRLTRSRVNVTAKRIILDAGCVVSAPLPALSGPPLARGHRTWGGGTFLSNPEGSPSAVRGLLAERAILVALFGPSDTEEPQIRPDRSGANPISRACIAGRVGGDRRVLLANSIYHLTNDGAVTMLAGQIVVLQSQFGGFGPAELGLLGGIALVVTAVFQFLFGIMSDRRDASRFLPIGIVILGLGSLFVTLSSSFWTVLVLVAVSRIGASFYHPVGISWIGREFQGPGLDRSMGFQSAFGDAGVILGMGSGAVLAVAIGWQTPFCLLGGF